MFKVTRYPHGTFSWADCSSTNAPAARQFYLDIMGWEADDQPIGEGMIYTLFNKDGETVAGLSQLPPNMGEMPSAWNQYVTVDDIDAIPDRVRQLGGKVIEEPFDVMENGRMMLLQDPEGAFLALWQAKKHIGASLVNTTGAMCWNELATRDVDRAQQFYGGLLGWTFTKLADSDYYIILNNGRSNGGMLPMDANWGDLPPHWMVYFSVDDLDALIPKIEASGGKVHVAPTDIPSGRFAVIADPTGAVITLIKPSQIDPWVE